MSDAPAEEKPAAPPGPKPPKIVLILLALNLGATGFTTFKVVTAPPPQAAEHHEKAEPEPVGPEVSGPVIQLDPFVVNLDEPGSSRYVKVTVQVELAKHDAEEPIEKSKQLIRDMFLSHLSGLKLADCLGATAKDKLREDLMKMLVSVVGPSKVRRLFFSEFVVQ